MSSANTPVESLGQKEIKAELTTRYGVMDFGDCLEIADLRGKLAAIRGTKPVTFGLRYGQLLEIGNKTNPTGLVTLSHGLGDTCFGWQDVGEELARRFPYLLFLLPTAPQRAVTINGGYAMPAWYDLMGTISTGLSSGRQDAAGVMQSAEYLSSLTLTSCKRLKIPTRRVCFCGFSQGAAVSGAAALLSVAVPPAGVAMLSGYLPCVDEVLAEHRKRTAESPSFKEHFTVAEKAVRFALFHGRQDPVVPIAAARETKTLLETEVLKGLSCEIPFHEYNMQHSAVPQEIDELARFLASVLPEKFSSDL